jgi:putative colanic acid biosynthesis UDP-glucose lipid carrier transferase
MTLIIKVLAGPADQSSRAGAQSGLGFDDHSTWLASHVSEDHAEARAYVSLTIRLQSANQTSPFCRVSLVSKQLILLSNEWACSGVLPAWGIVMQSISFTRSAPAHGPFAFSLMLIHVPLYGAAKRAIDVCMSFILILLLSPLLFSIGLAIGLTSKGRVLFKQKRYGLNAHEFFCYKFRTMHVCDADDSFVQCQPRDPRVTPVGAFLRRTSLDELPQLFNVLFGSMSLIGPRPHPLRLDEEFAAKILGYENRFRVKPGMTGLAQILGYRGPTPTLEDMKRRIDADSTYAASQSLWLDLQILIKTPLALIDGKNAF